MPPLSITVDALVLRGVESFDADRFGSALSGELGRLMAAGGGGVQAVQVGQVSLHPRGHSDSAALGVQVAHALHQQMRGGGR